MFKNLIEKLKSFFKKEEPVDVPTRGSIDDAVIIACYYNPENNPYRLTTFNAWYSKIKKYNHRIIECVIGDVGKQLPESPYISTIHTDSVLWHKETLLNKVIRDLDEKFKYVFWCDTDIMFDNANWLQESVDELQKHIVIQPFEYCVHLDQDELPDWAYPNQVDKDNCFSAINRPKDLWRSFCSNHSQYYSASGGKVCELSSHENYDLHGHVGFVWGARRELLDVIPLYEKGLIGGTDHLLAHGYAGHIDHECIKKSFSDDLDIKKYMEKLYAYVDGNIGYTGGTIYHLWHGDLNKRQYLKRIQDTNKAFNNINERDENGLFVSKDERLNTYIKSYLTEREAIPEPELKRREAHKSAPTQPKKPKPQDERHTETTRHNTTHHNPVSVVSSVWLTQQSDDSYSVPAYESSCSTTNFS